MAQVLVLPQTGALSQVSLPRLTDQPTDRPCAVGPPSALASRCLSPEQRPCPPVPYPQVQSHPVGTRLGQRRLDLT